MRHLVKVAMRNVSRNRKRTAITLVAVFVGVLVIMLISGLLNGLQGSFVDQITGGVTGDLQIQREGYRESAESAPLSLDVRVDDALVQTLDHDPGIAAWSPRVRFGGLISNGEDTAMFLGLAVDPARELQVASRSPENIVEGRWLNPDDPTGIILSEQLARSLHLKIGDEVTILANTREGSMNGRDYHVVGLLSSGLPTAPGRLVMIPSESAAPLLFMEDRATEIAIALKERDESPAVAARLDRALADTTPKLDVCTWQELAPFFVDLMNMQNFVFGIVVFILFLLVLTGVANTMLMSVFERTREIGTLMALGMRRRAVIVLFLAEALVLGAIGAAAGIAVGGGLLLILGSQGIAFEAPGTSLPLIIYPTVALKTLGLVVAFTVVCSLVSAFYPAWRASRLEPVAALRGA